MTITAQPSIGTQAAEPLDPQIVAAITEAVRTAMAEAAQTAPATEADQVVQTSGATDLTPLIFALFGTQAVLVGIVFAAVRWLDGRLAANMAAADSRRLEDKREAANQRTQDKREAARQRTEDRQATKEGFREVMSWIRWLVALHVGKPVGAVTAPPDDADLPELADLRREASAPQAA